MAVSPVSEFVRSLYENPGDDTPRLVAADRLDETGDPVDAKRAEWFRAALGGNRREFNYLARPESVWITANVEALVTEIVRPHLITEKRFDSIKFRREGRYLNVLMRHAMNPKYPKRTKWAWFRISMFRGCAYELTFDSLTEIIPTIVAAFPEASLRYIRHNNARLVRYSGGRLIPFGMDWGAPASDELVMSIDVTDRIGMNPMNDVLSAEINAAILRDAYERGIVSHDSFDEGYQERSLVVTYRTRPNNEYGARRYNQDVTEMVISSGFTDATRERAGVSGSYAGWWDYVTHNSALAPGGPDIDYSKIPKRRFPGANVPQPRELPDTASTGLTDPDGHSRDM